MTTLSLEEAQERRGDVFLNDFLDERLDVLLSAKTVSPEARRKLRHLLSYYAKKKHPFRSCTRDNLKRFGPGRTEKVCATIVDLIKGTTKWRRGRQTLAAAPSIDDEVEQIILSFKNFELEYLVMEASNDAA